MAKESEKVRLPELPVFKRFSLALRQEYASADEILSVINRTVTRINALLDQAEEARRRANGRDVPDAVIPEELDEPEEPEEEPEEVQSDAEEAEVLKAAAEALGPPDDTLDEALEDVPAEGTKEQEIESLLKGPETDVDSLFPLEEEQVDSFVPAEADEISALIKPETENVISAPPKRKPKPKRKRAQPEIVRVSKLGKPLGLTKPVTKPAAQKRKPTSRTRRPKTR